MKEVKEDEWLKERLAYIKGLKSKTNPQELIALLAEKNDKTPSEKNLLAEAIQVEKANIRTAELNAKFTNKINAKKKAEAEKERKARTHELCNLGGLAIMAGLAETKTGKPTINKSALMGGWLAMAKMSPEDPRFKDWIRAGDAFFAEQNK